MVAEREVMTKVREKSFIISSVVMLALVVGAIVLLNVLQDRPSKHDVGVVGQEARDVVAAASRTPVAKADNTTLTPRSYPDRSAAEAAVRAEKVDAALVVTDDGFELLGDRSVDDAIERTVGTAASSLALQRNAAAQDVDLSALQAGTSTTTKLLDPDARNADVRRAAAYVLVILFFLSAISFGMPIAQSITQEKESRVVEILAAAVPLRSLLWGKVVGNTLLAIGQVVSLLVVAAVALAAT
ncbi:MAG: ABC transporter permease, partial [Aeromicrobium erythreum]